MGQCYSTHKQSKREGEVVADPVTGEELPQMVTIPPQQMAELPPGASALLLQQQHQQEQQEQQQQREQEEQQPDQTETLSGRFLSRPRNKLLKGKKKVTVSDTQTIIPDPPRRARNTSTEAVPSTIAEVSSPEIPETPDTFETVATFETAGQQEQSDPVVDRTHPPTTLQAAAMKGRQLRQQQQQQQQRGGSRRMRAGGGGGRERRSARGGSGSMQSMQSLQSVQSVQSISGEVELVAPTPRRPMTLNLPMGLALNDQSSNSLEAVISEASRRENSGETVYHPALTSPPDSTTSLSTVRVRHSVFSPTASTTTNSAGRALLRHHPNVPTNSEASSVGGGGGDDNKERSARTARSAGSASLSPQAESLVSVSL